MAVFSLKGSQRKSTGLEGSPILRQAQLDPKPDSRKDAGCHKECRADKGAYSFTALTEAGLFDNVFYSVAGLSSVCLCGCLCLCLSACQSVLLGCLSVCLSVCASVCVCASACSRVVTAAAPVSVCLCLCLSLCVPVFWQMGVCVLLP